MTFSQWEALSESEREWWLARYRRRAVEHDCGHPRSVCSDPKKEWLPQFDVCYPTMERQAAQKRYDDLHQARPWHDGTFKSWVEERSASHPYHAGYGTTVWVSEEDGAGGDRYREVLGRAAEESGGDEAESEDAQE